MSTPPPGPVGRVRAPQRSLRARTLFWVLSAVGTLGVAGIVVALVTGIVVSRPGADWYDSTVVDPETVASDYAAPPPSQTGEDADDQDGEWTGASESTAPSGGPSLPPLGGTTPRPPVPATPESTDAPEATATPTISPTVSPTTPGTPAGALAGLTVALGSDPEPAAGSTESPAACETTGTPEAAAVVAVLAALLEQQGASVTPTSTDACAPTSAEPAVTSADLLLVVRSSDTTPFPVVLGSASAGDETVQAAAQRLVETIASALDDAGFAPASSSATLPGAQERPAVLVTLGGHRAEGPDTSPLTEAERAAVAGAVVDGVVAWAAAAG